MTGAEFKTFREALGLTCQHVATLTECSIRAIHYWESDTSRIPLKAKVLLKNIDESLNRYVLAIDAAVRDAISKSMSPQSITLLRFLNDVDLWAFHPEMAPLSISTHAVMLTRVQHHFDGSLIVRIEYMRPNEYRKWLNGRQDSEQMRSAWASCLSNNR